VCNKINDGISQYLTNNNLSSVNELVGNYEICIQGHFYEATIFKMAANKIVKLSMVSDFNVHGFHGNGGHFENSKT
jgi:hypothetical protein